MSEKIEGTTENWESGKLGLSEEQVAKALPMGHRKRTRYTLDESAGIVLGLSDFEDDQLTPKRCVERLNQQRAEIASLMHEVVDLTERLAGQERGQREVERYCHRQLELLQSELKEARGATAT